jgi:acetyl-CoA synthetase
MADPVDPEISALLHEDRVFEAPPAFRAAAIVRDTTPYDEAEHDFEGFWAKFASELEWSRKWTTVLDWSNPPHAKWFVGGQINAVGQLRRSPYQDRAAEQSGHHLGGRAWRSAHADVL